jgi:hypothetical protein
MKTILVAVLVLWGSRAEADDGTNMLIGPVLGIVFGGHSGSRSLIGIEGGVGFGPERLNVGLEHRDGKLFGYVEVDPWLILGGSLGVGIDSDRVISPILGVWEGLEIRGPGCNSGTTGAMVTVAAGYRFAGVHELYITVKAGRGRDICIPRD